MFLCDFNVKYQFLGVISQSFYHMLEFTDVEPLSAYESPDLCDELAGPF